MANDILIVDDEADIRSLIEDILKDEGHETRSAGSSSAALAEVRARRPSLVILDIWLQGSPIDGLDVLKAVKRDHPDLPVIMISGHGNIETAVSAIQLGAYDFIEKPFESDRLILIVQRAIEAARLRRENDELRQKVSHSGEILGSSSVMNQLRQSIERVAPTGSRVLITGAPGAGKEVVARMIHSRSRRGSGPFVVLNCATMTPSRLEEELFGVESEEGVRKIGFLEQAHGGSLLLDEVADMPIETQGKIVRILQDQRFRRLGGKIEVKVEIRVLAATNRDLPDLISQGQFREDLYYRLNVVPIRVPPLRDRRDDIPELVDSFIEKAAAASGLGTRRIGGDALAALQSYDWPGNVRQLRNVVERLLIMAPGDPNEAIKADMLPPEIGAITPSTLRLEGGGEIMGLPLRDARELFEREYLTAQVTRFGGNISKTATFVGMERSALHRKLKSLGLQNFGDRNTKAES